MLDDDYLSTNFQTETIFFVVLTANQDECDMCCFALFMLVLLCFVVF